MHGIILRFVLGATLSKALADIQTLKQSVQMYKTTSDSLTGTCNDSHRVFTRQHHLFPSILLPNTCTHKNHFNDSPWTYRNALSASLIKLSSVPNSTSILFLDCLLFYNGVPPGALVHPQRARAIRPSMATGRGFTLDSVYCRDPLPVKTRSCLHLHSRMSLWCMIRSRMRIQTSRIQLEVLRDGTRWV